MGMKVTESSLDKTLRRFEKAPKAVENATVEVFGGVGAEVVEKIRNGELSSWDDQSGSLRSSVGGGVCCKGRIVKTVGFDTVLNGSDGARKGKELLEKLAIEYARYDVVLIIVAGEEYAVYVEAIEGKVVLSSGLLHIEHTLMRLLKERITQALRRL